jgi:penicillin amidase
MRIWPLIISSLLTGGLAVALNTSFSPLPALGPFFSPQQGFWQNADAVNANYSEALHFDELSSKVKVCLDNRLVPHIFAEKESDTYFAEGFLHAKFRLWQMEIQTHLAAGRLSEILGRYSGSRDNLQVIDRNYRRLGMGYAAEQALKAMEANPVSKSECDAYTEGVNAYISTLTLSTLPLEYKLLDYKPEPWTNLKTALLLKLMCLDLSGGENDFPMTNARSLFSASDFELLYPTVQDSVDPIVPKGTVLYDLVDTPAIRVRIPAHADSVYMMAKGSPLPYDYWKPDKDNGSNNWAVAGSKTRSGAPILCNDPHLALNLPSLWFELQITAPGVNAYGVSFPGAPGVIIGFNDSCAFGFTNSERDVRDYYEILFRDPTRKEYRFNNNWVPTTFRVEDIKIKGAPDFMDTVAYTVFGPVMYEPDYPDPLRTGKYYACRWAAQDSSNDLLAFIGLDHARNYNDYLSSIKNLRSPGQNCIFASVSGDIALWQQGAFPAKWFRQGDFVMPGSDSSYAWQGTIPQAENPHMINPVQGFVGSANQIPVDPKTYPYYLGGSFPPYRGMEIDRRLEKMDKITASDMMDLQTDNYDIFAEMARPLFVRFVDTEGMEPAERSYYNLVRDWNLENNPGEKAPSIFNSWWDSLKNCVYGDELGQTRLPIMQPYDETLLEALLKDSTYKFVDDIRTPQTETLRQIATMAWKKAYPHLLDKDSFGQLTWAAFKDTHISHLTKLPALSDLHLPVGGGTFSINAAKSDHGPSWRMVVELTSPVKAYAIYPGGQSGNPGSPYYDDMIQSWVKGSYDTLWVMTPNQQRDSRVLWKMDFSK